MNAISTVLRQWCDLCGQATITAICRRYGPPNLCCARHCCPLDGELDGELVIVDEDD